MNKLPIQYRWRESFHQHRDRVALECRGLHISYGELAQKSALITRWLCENSGRETPFTGIYLEDKIQLTAIVLGILGARRGFVPLDTGHPVNRIVEMIKATQLPLVFTDDKHYPQLAEHEGLAKTNTRIVTIENIKSLYRQDFLSPPTIPEEISYDPEDNIYIYFTSGTTGTPKGFVGVNKSLVHFIQWEIDSFDIDKNDCFSQFSTPGFDAFLRDIFVPLTLGARLCIPGGRDIIMSTRNVIHWLETRQVRLVHCVPGIFRVFNSDTLRAGQLKALKYVLMAGERLIPAELKNWYNIFGPRI
ncbi:MAG: AMP-binding protein, partial [bacterium]|nr:AMP-binding protein [bacterium]